MTTTADDYGTGVELGEVARWVDVLKTATAAKRQAEESIEVARGHIEAALGEAETGLVDGWPVVRWTRINSRRFDQTLAKERVPADVLALCYTTSTSRRFSIVED
jgi:hypothetical protein